MPVTLQPGLFADPRPIFAELSFYVTPADGLLAIGLRGIDLVSLETRWLGAEAAVPWDHASTAARTALSRTLRLCGEVTGLPPFP